MKIETLVKSTSSAGKVKYFRDHLQASFHIQTGSGNTLQFKIEPCSVLVKDDAYFSLAKIDEKLPIEESVKNLAPHTIHSAYEKYIETYDGGGSGFGASVGYNVLAILNPSEDSYYSRYAFNICVDENRTVFKVEDRIQIQKPSSEYEAIKPTINDAIARASQRQSSEYKQAASLFSQRKADFERAKQELERKQAELDMEAKMLASDAMDYSQ